MCDLIAVANLRRREHLDTLKVNGLTLTIKWRNTNSVNIMIGNTETKFPI